MVNYSIVSELDEEVPESTLPVVLSSMAEPWEQLPQESAKAFEAFVLYRDMPPSARGLSNVGKVLSKSTTLMSRWSSAYLWVDRCRAFDRFRDLTKQAKLEQEYERMAERHSTQAQAIAQALMLPAQQLLKRLSEDPEALYDELSAMELAEQLTLMSRMAAVWPNVMKAERLSRGQPTEVIGGPAEGAFEHVIRLEPGQDALAYLRAIAELTDSDGNTDTDD